MHAEDVSPDESRKEGHVGIGHAVATEETVVDVIGLHHGSSREDGQKSSALRAYFRLWAYASPLDVVLRLVGAAAALGGGSAYPLMAIIFGSLVNAFNSAALGDILGPEFRSSVNRNSLWFIYLFLGKFGLLYIADFLYSFTATRMARRIRLRYLENVLHQPVSYFDRHTSGSIAMSLSTDANLIEVGLADKVASVFQSCGMIITAFVIAFTKSWKMTLVVGIIIPYMIIVTIMLGSLDSRLESKQREAYSKASSIAEEALSSITNITALGAKDRIVEKFKRPLTVASRYGIKKGPIQASIYGNMFFSMQSGYALALFYGVKLVSRGEIEDGGTVVIVLFCMILGSSAMGLVAPSIPVFLKAAASAQQLLKLLDKNIPTSGNDDQRLKLKPEAIRGQLKIQNLIFSYPERPTVNVLDNLSLDIPAEQVTAIVGHSGSGKSTIVGLIERWYSPSKGSICLDGTDIEQLDLHWLRDQIGLVQQDPVLFNDTILQNVLNGLHGGQADHLGEEEKLKLVIGACTQANAHEFIKDLPQGYETNVGERAGLLSGGQKQRIAIARSIISNPKILLLDEATSALDSQSERAVQAALEKASRGRTTLMIAHKLSTVENADKIVVVDKGRIVEQGTHASLLAQDGVYCSLLHAQSFSTLSKIEMTPASSGDTRQGFAEKAPSQVEPLGTQRPADVAPNLASESISRQISLLRCIFVILSETRSILPAITCGTVGAFVAGAAIPVQAFLFSKLITVFQLQDPERIDRGNFWALMFFFLALANLISYAVLWFFFSVAGAAVSRKYRAEYLRGMLAQDIGFSNAQGNSSGALAALLSTDGDDVEAMFNMSLALIIVFFIDIASCCILAVAISWKLGLVGVFGCYPVLFFAGYVRMRMDITAQDRCTSTFLESARFGSEAVEAIRTVSSLTLESKVIERYGDRLHKASITSSKRTIFSTMLFALSDCTDFLAIGLVFWYGGTLVSYGEISVGQFFIVYTAIIFGGQGAGFIFGYSSSMAKAYAAANRMLYMKTQKPTINSSTGADPHETPPGETIIEFRSVRFRYPTRPDVEVLRGVDFTVRKGENICIVGSSGCGKSTMISLLERFYDITSGELLIYGNRISALDIKAFRSTLGLVSQETSLYQGTVRENLVLGVDGEVDDETLVATSKDASIHDFIASLPEGYNTDCGPRGLSLSGGQRQRIAIVRALLRKPEILLLDEATSALDPEGQSLVINALKKVAKGRTIISVTHQTEIIEQADCVFVIEHGRVVESGTYKELLLRKGKFWEMEGELIVSK